MDTVHQTGKLKACPEHCWGWSIGSFSGHLPGSHMSILALISSLCSKPCSQPALTEPCPSMPRRRRIHPHLCTPGPREVKALLFQPCSLVSPCTHSWPVAGEGYASGIWLRDFASTRQGHVASQNMVGLLWLMLLCSDTECPLIFLVKLNCHHRAAGE